MAVKNSTTGRSQSLNWLFAFDRLAIYLSPSLGVAGPFGPVPKLAASACRGWTEKEKDCISILAKANDPAANFCMIRDPSGHQQHAYADGDAWVILQLCVLR